MFVWELFLYQKPELLFQFRRTLAEFVVLLIKHKAIIYHKIRCMQTQLFKKYAPEIPEQCSYEKQFYLKNPIIYVKFTGP